jgi:hypothetical protein
MIHNRDKLAKTLCKSITLLIVVAALHTSAIPSGFHRYLPDQKTPILFTPESLC